jgi:hypothetical protein
MVQGVNQGGVTIRKGDTLGSIAARHGLTIEQLKQLNPELFLNGADAQGRQRSVDGRWVYPGDVVRVSAAATSAAPTSPISETAATSDRVVAAAKQFIDAAATSADPGVAQEAQAMLALIPAADPQRQAYQQKVEALAARAPVTAPASAGSSDLQTASEAFNDASRAFDQAQNDGARAAARAQATLAYQQAAQAVKALPAGENRDIAQGQLEMMEMRLKGMGSSDAAINTARQAAGLQPRDAAAPTGPGGTPAPAAAAYDPAAQDAFAAAQAKFDEASEGYDKSIKSSKSLAEAAAAIQASQQKALAAYQEAVTAGTRVGPSTQPALDAMADRLKKMGVSQQVIADAKTKGAAAAPSGKGATPPTAGGPQPSTGTPLPVGPLAQPTAQPQAPAPTALVDQFGMQRQLFMKAIEDYVNASTNGDQVGAENARARAKAAYTEAAKLVGQMDVNTKPSYNKMLDDMEDKLQYYRVASIAEMDPIRKAAKLAPSASTAWAPANQAPGAVVPDVSKVNRNGASPTNAPDPANEEPKNEDEKKARAALATSLPKMNSGQIAKMPYDQVKAASSEQRGHMLKELLDHWWVGDDKKKYAADIIEIASYEGKLDATLRQMDAQMKGGGIAKIFSKLKGTDRQRTVKNIFWDLKDTNRIGTDVMMAVSQHMNKDDVRAVLQAYGHGPSSAWFKRIPPEVKGQWAKVLEGGWFGKSSSDGELIQALKGSAAQGR